MPTDEGGHCILARQSNGRRPVWSIRFAHLGLEAIYQRLSTRFVRIVGRLIKWHERKKMPATENGERDKEGKTMFLWCIYGKVCE